MHKMNLNDMMRSPALVAARAAKLDVIVCEYRAQAARLRLQAIEWELVGDPVRAADFADRAEVMAADAAAVERQRRELLGRFALAEAAELELMQDDRGVYA